MPRSLGRHQIAECQRSGAKCRAADLVRDGRNPSLLVLPEWADAEHPQEHMPALGDRDGAPRFDVAPESIQETPPVLEADVVAGPAVQLTWTAADTIGRAFETYDVYRAPGDPDDGDFVLLTSLAVDFSRYAVGDDGVPISFSDDTVSAATAYRYRVDAVDDSEHAAASNVVTAVVS